MNTQLRWLVPAETATTPPRLQVRSVNSIGQVIIDWRDVPLVVSPEVGTGERSESAATKGSTPVTTGETTCQPTLTLCPTCGNDFRKCVAMRPNANVTGAARPYRAASVLTAGLCPGDDKGE